MEDNPQSVYYKTGYTSSRLSGLTRTGGKYTLQRPKVGGGRERERALLGTISITGNKIFSRKTFCLIGPRKGPQINTERKPQTRAIQGKRPTIDLAFEKTQPVYVHHAKSRWPYILSVGFEPQKKKIGTGPQNKMQNEMQCCQWGSNPRPH